MLFLCIGNACRSQMAEAFARAYGSDVLSPVSAGLAPAYSIPDLTLKVMQDKNISLSGHFPKGLDTWLETNFDLIVDLSGCKPSLSMSAPVQEWTVEDPIGADEETYHRVRDQIEQLVMRLVLVTRNEARATATADPPAEDQRSRPMGRRKFLR